jgi:hypothetical protein
MQPIRPQLTTEIEKHLKKRDVWQAPAFEVGNYRDLVEHVARLAYANRNQLLFFRGQNKDYQNKAGGSTLYPAIYRGDNVAHAELEVRFRQLMAAERILSQLFSEQRIEGARDVARKRYIQWSILQHYEVVATPLLDVTQSLRVACSFAQMASTEEICYVYVLGLPFTTNRISINSEEDVVNIRLLSICPPAALRPYYQEGYMAGTPDITTDFDSKTELDFRNRLIAKFAIPRAKRFWNVGFEAIPKTALYPSSDLIEVLCRQLEIRIDQKQSVGDLGQFLVDWGRLEERIVPRARQLTERNLSVRDAIRALTFRGALSPSMASRLEQVRRVRNMAAHQPTRVTVTEVQYAHRLLRDLQKNLSLD